MAETVFPANGVPQELAALDLGSNSFHLIVAQESGGHLQTLDKIREMVRLAEGLGDRQRLTAAASHRALACLERFGQRLRHLRRENVRVVGTNALRKARDSEAFIESAERALGHRVEIISGREEARLIYLGVSHALEDNYDRRLVIDIGGGSTELILGRQFQPEVMESLYIGSAAQSQQCFADGAITRRAFRQAINHCLRELEAVRSLYPESAWDVAIGASGTLLAVRDVLAGLRKSEAGYIRPDGVANLMDRLIEAKRLDRIDLPGLSPERRPVFPGGVAVLAAVIEALNVECLEVSEGSLREGLLQDLLGRVHHQDIRDATVRNLMDRYHVDAAHAKRVRDTALALLAQVAVSWRLQAAEHRLLLAWAADLHEVGMDIAHNQYHKHGGYLLAHMDMPGFSRLDQSQLATLVRLHRRKFAVDDQALPAEGEILRLTALLRLAVILHRSRSNDALPHVAIEADGGQMVVTLFKEWLAKHPLTKLDLKEEARYLQASSLSLKVKAR
ncbi:MAG: Ppx/GppA phosphatase family protein [Gammaproteobacteria bacterium]|nr:Ppx/GppA phosphatase family protein [Gammaproteobacteria bacterium]